MTSAVAEPPTTEVPTRSLASKLDGWPSATIASPKKKPLKQLSVQRSPTPHSGNAGDATREPEQPKLDSQNKLPGVVGLGLEDENITRSHRQSISDVSDKLAFVTPSVITHALAGVHHDARDVDDTVLKEIPPPVTPPMQTKRRASPDRGTGLRVHHLLQLESQGSPSSVADSGGSRRNISLPLQRFINENVDPTHVEPDGLLSEGNESPVAPASPALSDLSLVRMRSGSHGPFDHLGHGEPSLLRSVFSHDFPGSRSEASFASSAARSIDTQPGSPHYRPQLLNLVSYLNKPKRRPSLESLGLWKNNDTQSSRRSSISTQGGSTRSGLSALKQPTDYMDEKISSILTHLPARIHFLSRDDPRIEGSPVLSSLARKTRERFSESPERPPSASSTQAPSLFLASGGARSRRQSTSAASHAPDDRSVRMYHLGDPRSKNPTKLLVRSVGESSERLMVRVGGGWADLGEYLKEYAIHHGKRRVPEVPKAAEEDSLPQPPADGDDDIFPDDQSSTILKTLEDSSSRPASIADGSSRPPSPPLFIRKTRRPSNVSALSDFSTMRSGRDPPSSIPSRGRQWTSLKHSSSSTSLASDSRAVSSPLLSQQQQHSIPTPLGLAGPQSRRVSMTPENQAWVDNVLGQARRSSSSLKPPPPPSGSGSLRIGGPRVSSLPKTISVSDAFGVGRLRSRKIASSDRERKEG